MMHLDNLGLRNLRPPDIVLAEYNAGASTHQVMTEIGLLTIIRERDTVEREANVFQPECPCTPVDERERAQEGVTKK